MALKIILITLLYALSYPRFTYSVWLKPSIFILSLFLLSCEEIARLKVKHNKIPPCLLHCAQKVPSHAQRKKKCRGKIQLNISKITMVVPWFFPFLVKNILKRIWRPIFRLVLHKFPTRNNVFLHEGNRLEREWDRTFCAQCKVAWHRTKEPFLRTLIIYI